MGNNGARRISMPLIPHHAHLKRLAIEEPTEQDPYQDPQHQHSRSRSRRRLSAQQIDAAYQGYGVHYVDIWTGTPPQRQTVIVGTGSGGIGFPCSDCLDCGHKYHIDNFFQQTKSLTFQELRCGQCKVGHCNSAEVHDSSGRCSYGMAYAEGSSWSGYEARDMAYVGGPHDKPIAKGTEEGQPHDDIDPDQAREYQFGLNFVCQTKITGLFKTQMADGILGMDNSPASYWNQALQANVTDNGAFSLCFARQPTASRNGTEAGSFSLGGYDKRLHNENSPVVYGKYDKKTMFYSLDLKGIFLRKGGGGESALSTDPNITIIELKSTEIHPLKITIDTGTTDTYLPRAFNSDFRDHWKQLTNISYTNTRMVLTEEQLQSLPTVLFRFQGDTSENRKLGTDPYPLGTFGSAVPSSTRPSINNLDLVVAMPPSHYMEYKNGYYTNRLYFSAGITGSTLGANFMMGHDVTFDTDNGWVGFAESTCDYLAVLDEFHERNPWENDNDGHSVTKPISYDSYSNGNNNNGGTNQQQIFDNSNLPDPLPTAITNSYSSPNSGGSSQGGTIALFVGATVIIAVGALYGKKYYNQYAGDAERTYQYQVTRLAENELELQPSTNVITTEGGGGGESSQGYVSPTLNLT